MIDTLLHFLKTGELGGIRVGMPRDAVRRMLGDPHDVSPSTDLWLYGDQGSANVQLPFAADRVLGIWVYFLGSANTDSIPNSLNASLWTIDGQSAIVDLTAQLDERAVKWRIHDPLTSADQTCILLQSKVHCLWSHDSGTGLQKIMLTDGCDDWLPQMQLQSRHSKQSTKVAGRGESEINVQLFSEVGRKSSTLVLGQLPSVSQVSFLRPLRHSGNNKTGQHLFVAFVWVHTNVSFRKNNRFRKQLCPTIQHMTNCSTENTIPIAAQ